MQQVTMSSMYFNHREASLQCSLGGSHERLDNLFDLGLVQLHWGSVLWIEGNG